MAAGRATLAVRRQLRLVARRLPDLFQTDARLAVGFSGGQDSTCLLHALRDRDLGFDIDVIGIHVDHALRAESGDDATRVVALGASFEIPVEVVRIDVAAYRQRLPRWSVQQAARAARYQALAAAAARHAARAVLVAHTEDDQAETVLLNLVRGTGLQGLAGMPLDERLELRRMGPPVRGLDGVPEQVRVARPLLRVARGTTFAYCGEQGLTVVEDASNQKRAYTRNRVRLDALPALEQFNPAVREALARTADLAAEDQAVLEGVVDALHADLARVSEGVASYPMAAWREQPLGLRRRLLRRGLAILLGELVDVRAAPVDDALEVLASGIQGQTYHLPYGVELRVDAESFELRRHGRALERSSRNSWEGELPQV
jgi:tRNA(Ile)-lysidine synthase